MLPHNTRGGLIWIMCIIRDTVQNTLKVLLVGRHVSPHSPDSVEQAWNAIRLKTRLGRGLVPQARKCSEHS